MGEMQLAPQIEIGGVQFDINIEPDGEVWLKHPKWSVIGSGKTLIEAEADLLRQATEVAPHFTSKARWMMSYEAQLLTDWLLRVTPVSTA